MSKVIVGGIVGAIIAFIWQFVSWGVLPWHNYAINEFKNPDFVSWVIKENAPVSGVYVAPYHKPDKMSLSAEEIIKEVEEQKEAMVKGPFIYTQVKLCGINPSSPYLYVYSFLTQFVGAALISFLLLKMSQAGYRERLFAVIMIGLLVGVLGYGPDWNWFGAGYKFTLIMIADLIITWFLAGLFLAGYAKRREARQ